MITRLLFILILMVFISKYASLEVVLQPTRYQLDSFGNRMAMPGIRVNFEKGFYETDDQKIIDGLRSHVMFGIDFWSGDGKSVVSDAGKAVLKTAEEGRQTTIHSCPTCSFKAKNESALKAHITAKHPAEVGEE